MASSQFNCYGSATVSAGTRVPLIPASSQAVARNNHGYVIQSYPLNSTNLIYLLNNSSAPDLVNFTNIVYIFSTPGESFPNNSVAVDNLDLNGLYVDGVHTGDVLYSSGTVV